MWGIRGGRSRPRCAAGQLECARALLEAGARVSARCEGSGVLHAAVCVAALPGRAAFGGAAVQLLVAHGASPADKRAPAAPHPITPPSKRHTDPPPAYLQRRDFKGVY